MTTWPTRQLAEFLAAVSGFRDEASATRGAAERAAEALGAEVAAILQHGQILTVVGFPGGQGPAAELAAVAAAGGHGRVELPGLGPCRTLVTSLDHLEEGRLVLARSSGGFSGEEADLAGGMGRVLALTVQMLRGIEEAERRAVEVARLNELMEERQRLLERLSKIQRSISTRAPLDQVLDAIVRGARELVGDGITALRLLDSDDPAVAVLVASTGVEPEVLKRVRRGPAGHGVGGRAIVEDRLVVVEDYGQAPGALPEFAARRLKAAMAAPVHENGVVVGSLAIASYDPGRAYSRIEQEVLLAFAEHASLALTDARTVDAMHQAFHDPLTGLPNRALFAERLDERLRREDGQAVAVLFLDLDRFKLVNDSLGHDAGDELLGVVAERLGTCLDDGLVARFGGDEFAVQRAIDEGQLRLMFQPTIDLSTSRITGLEALVRWQHPERGSVSPAEFIPLAEETGQIVPIGRWVLRQACEQAGRWQAAFRAEPPLAINVNLSSRQLAQPDVVSEVAEVLAATRVAPTSLIIEITETTLMRDTEATLAKLRDLKALGIRLAVDDFGTGYSSLGYLRRFPFDVLKLDKSFVDGVAAAPEDAALCHAVIRLGEALKLTVVAEGIEAYEQAVELHRLGCDLGQGYYFARPMTAEDATELLRLPWIADQRPTPATAVTGQPAPSGPATVEPGRPAPAER